MIFTCDTGIEQQNTYAVVDLEMCRVSKKVEGYHYRHETIQIGAVLMDEKFEIVGHFKTYVKPEYGHVDSFIRRLTGITDGKLKNAPSFEEALFEFEEWLPEDVKLIAWSGTDQSQLIKEMEEKKISSNRPELYDAPWIDCQELFDRRIEAERAYALEQALNLADIPYEDGLHDGYIDAYNTALLYKKLMTEPVLRLNQYYLHSGEVEDEPLSVPMGDLFKGIQL